jgi:ADP-heptose:LPS heptosyltransferase
VTSPPVHEPVAGVRTIGVLRANRIGDFFMIVPALEALRRTYPQADLTILSAAWLPPFLADRPGPWDRAVTAPEYPGLRGRSPDDEPGADVDTFVQEHAGRYDLLLQMHGGGRTSNAFVNLLRPPIAVGARSPDAGQLDRWIPYVPQRHEMLRWLEVAALVGARGPASPQELRPRLTVTATDLDESRCLWPEDEPTIVFHCGSHDHRRRWAARNFVGLGRVLAEELQARILLVGGPADRPCSAEVAAGLGSRVRDLTGRLSLRGTLGLLSRSRLFVGNDSGPRHLATAAGTPTVGLFWVGNLLTFGPLVGGRDRAVTAYRFECPVCGEPQVDRRCGHDVSFLDEITVAAVHEAAVAALGAAAEPTGTHSPTTNPS